MPKHTLDWRRCQLCKESSFVYRDGEYRLFKYGIRHYAHALCLARSRGSIIALELIPEHKHAQFRARLADANAWDRDFIAVKDRATMRVRARNEAR